MTIPDTLYVILTKLSARDPEVRATNRDLAEILGLPGTAWKVEVKRSLRKLEERGQVTRTFDEKGRALKLL